MNVRPVLAKPIIALSALCIALLPNVTFANTQHSNLSEGVCDSSNVITMPSISQSSHIQHPIEGGTWEYGHWDWHIRSYYTVGKCHGTTVKAWGRTARSIDTDRGYKSIAELAE